MRVTHVYIIFRREQHRHISDYSEEVGVVVGDHLEAQAVVDRLNESEGWVKEENSSFLSPRPIYYRVEKPVLTLENCLE